MLKKKKDILSLSYRNMLSARKINTRLYQQYYMKESEIHHGAWFVAWSRVIRASIRLVNLTNISSKVSNRPDKTPTRRKTWRCCSLSSVTSRRYGNSFSLAEEKPVLRIKRCAARAREDVSANEWWALLINCENGCLPSSTKSFLAGQPCVARENAFHISLAARIPFPVHITRNMPRSV